MIARNLLLAMLAIACTGCVGVMFDGTKAETIEMPLPLKYTGWGPEDTERWACQPDPERALQTKSDFLASWGEPQSKEVSAEEETWIYAESGRWCGIWIAFIVPLPAMLPVCETYDKITFKNDLAVRANSRRFVRSAIGIVGAAASPVPVFTRPGGATDNYPSINPFHKSNHSCEFARQQEEASTSNEVNAIEESTLHTVSCFSGGKRQWVDKSLCD